MTVNYNFFENRIRRETLCITKCFHHISFNWETQLKNFKEGGKFSTNDNKYEVMNYSYIFAKDIFEYNQRKGKM